MWYFTSPPPSTLRGSTSSNPAKTSSGGALGDVGDHVQASAMAHAHHQFDGAVFAGSLREFHPPAESARSRLRAKTACPQISLLQTCSKRSARIKLIQSAILVHLGLRTFHALLNPAAPLQVGDVHELCAHGSAIEAAGFLREFAFDSQIRDGYRTEGNLADRGRLRDIPSGGKARKSVHVRQRIVY